ncbi:MAG TPA: YbhN family protein [Solimonas sp.]|nr:YbhN family protein [Solimonas sp.]
MSAHGRWQRRVGPALTLAFILLFAVLLWNRADSIDWPAVGRALRGYEAAVLLQALLLTLLGHAAFACYDLIGRRYAGHALPVRRVLPIAVVGYVCNLNFGALLGGIGLRYRLYARHGLATGQITRVIGLGIVTHWSGYLLLAGAVFLLAPPPWPADWPAGPQLLRGTGALLLVMLLLWLAACAFAGQRRWRIRQLQLRLPRLRMAALQLVLALGNWLLVALVIARLMPAEIPPLAVLGCYYLSVLATLVVRIPGGVGVVEAVFLALLGPRYGAAGLLAALLAWRAIYYLLPLLLAAPLYLRLEQTARQRVAAAPA